ncbi:MAG: sulfite exporter TauE/SafE family protein [Nitrospinae bacterium]|nr:sulfite exporter TauE/SafE family protein [Nitrospinota bacterium]
MRIFILILLLLCIADNSIAAVSAMDGHKLLSDISDIIPILLIGVFIGTIGTLIGAGGGFIHVPILLIFYDFSPQHAIGTSMAVVYLNALSGTFSYMLQKRIDYEIGIKFSVAAVPGVFIGAMLSRSFDMNSFSLILGLLLSLMSYSIFFGKRLSVVRVNALEQPLKRRLIDASGQVYSYAPDMPVGLSVSFFVGIISGLFGIGGGIIHVPLMYSVLGMPIHLATATSHFILAITSLLGVITFMGLKYIDIDYAVLLGVGSIIGAYFGAKISLRTEAVIIKKIIALCLMLMAVRLIGGVFI